MNPSRKKMAAQIVALVTVSRKACARPCAVSSTGPICAMPRFSSKSPALAHTTIAKTITSVLIRSRLSLAILGGLVVSGSGRCSGHRNHGFVVFLAAFAHPVQALRAQFQEFRCFRIQALPLVAVPQSIFHDAPDDSGPEIVFIVEAVDAVHHLRLREVRILDMR